MTATPTPAPSAAHALIAAGSAMANMLYNLKQTTIGDERLRASMAKCQEAWDAAVNDFRSLEASTVPAAEPALYQCHLEDGSIEHFAGRFGEVEAVNGVRVVKRTPLYASPQPARETEAARDVLAERQRQIEVEGWTPEHDDHHTGGEMAKAASCYARRSTTGLFPSSVAVPPGAWPWHRKWWKPSTPRRDLVKAGALILAEIERLDRAALRAGEQP